MIPWSRLNTQRQLIQEIVGEWEALLADSTCLEEAYQRYLSENAGIFFGMHGACYCCASKVNLGGDHQTDFLVPYDEGSRGFAYEFVEIESPHHPAFTKAGIPSQRLLGALKQISDWRRWLSKNQNEAKRLFPSKAFTVYGEPWFQFTIYISTRRELTERNDLRVELEKAHEVSIRSFDRLTEAANRRAFFDSSRLFSAEEAHLTEDQKNGLSDPFFMALTGKEWKEMVTSRQFDHAHMVANNVGMILRKRKSNSYRERFVRDVGG